MLQARQKFNYLYHVLKFSDLIASVAVIFSFLQEALILLSTYSLTVMKGR